jgi:hypothetical protein
MGVTQEPKRRSQQSDTQIQNHDDAYFAPLDQRQVTMDGKYNTLTTGAHKGVVL